MKFEKLNEMIPYVRGGKAKVLTMHPYNAITLAMPGRHAMDTDPIGGDFVVMVDDDTMDWTKHQFTHTDIFKDLAAKAEEMPNSTADFTEFYLKVIKGASPEKMNEDEEYTFDFLAQAKRGIHPTTLIYSLQCLAVAEHRRYARFENKFGGRYLPFRFSAGIVEGLWTATDAIERQRRGRPGAEWLEKEFGTPTLTKELMND